MLIHSANVLSIRIQSIDNISKKLPETITQSLIYTASQIQDPPIITLSNFEENSALTADINGKSVFKIEN